LTDKEIRAALRTRGRKPDPLWKRALAARAQGRNVLTAKPRRAYALQASIPTLLALAERLNP